MQNKLQKLQNRAAHAFSFSTYDHADAISLNSLDGKTWLTNSKSKELQWFIGLCTGCLQTTYVPNLKNEKLHTT